MIFFCSCSVLSFCCIWIYRREEMMVCYYVEKMSSCSHITRAIYMIPKTIAIKKCSLLLLLFYLQRHQNFQEAQTRQKKRIKTKTNKLILFSVKKKNILPLVERYMMNKITHRT